MKQSIYLNDRENRAIELLANGARMRDVRDACQFETSPSLAFQPFLAELRRKTGVSDIQSVPLCRAFVEGTHAAPDDPELSETHCRLLEHLLEQAPLAHQMRLLKLSESEIAAQLAEALRLCGIFATDPRTRRMQVRLHFAIRGNAHSKRLPLSTSHWRILAAIERGEDAKSLGFLPNQARLLTKEAYARAWITCPGKDAQKRLAAVFMRARAPKPPVSTPAPANEPPATPADAQPVTMDDPLF